MDGGNISQVETMEVPDVHTYSKRLSIFLRVFTSVRRLAWLVNVSSRACTCGRIHSGIFGSRVRGSWSRIDGHCICRMDGWMRNGEWRNEACSDQSPCGAEGIWQRVVEIMKLQCVLGVHAWDDGAEL